MRAWIVIGLLLGVSSAGAAPGDVVFARRLGGPGLDHGWGLATDARGNLLLSGFGDAPLDLGGGVRGAKQRDGVFVVSLSPAGGHRWSARLPTGESFYAGPLGVAADGAALLTGDRGPDLFFARVAAGKLIAAFSVPQASGLGVAAAAGGDVVIVGDLRGRSGFVGRYAADGKERWRKPLDGNGVAVAMDSQDRLTVSGSSGGGLFVERPGSWRILLGSDDFTEGRVQLAALDDGGVIVAYSSRPGTVVRLDAQGKTVWTHALDGINVGGVTTGKAGEVFVARDDTVSALAADGTRRWTTALAGDQVNLRGVAVDGKGRPCVTGWFAGTLRAGAQRLVSAGGYDVLLVCFAP